MTADDLADYRRRLAEHDALYEHGPGMNERVYEPADCLGAFVCDDVRELLAEVERLTADRDGAIQRSAHANHAIEEMGAELLAAESRADALAAAAQTARKLICDALCTRPDTTWHTQPCDILRAALGEGER